MLERTIIVDGKNLFNVLSLMVGWAKGRITIFRSEDLRLDVLKPIPKTFGSWSVPFRLKTLRTGGGSELS